MDTISTKKLSEKMNGLSLYTLVLYLHNFRFNKFRTTFSAGAVARYLLNQEFLCTLYTLLKLKRKDTAANNLKKHFQDYKIFAYDLEEFVCEN